MLARRLLAPFPKALKGPVGSKIRYVEIQFGIMGVLSGGFRAVNSFVETNELGSSDKAFTDVRIKKDPYVGENRRDFTYFVLGGARFVYASVARIALIKVGG